MIQEDAASNMLNMWIIITVLLGSYVEDHAFRQGKNVI